MLESWDDNCSQFLSWTVSIIYIVDVLKPKFTVYLLIVKLPVEYEVAVVCHNRTLYVSGLTI